MSSVTFEIFYTRLQFITTVRSSGHDNMFIGEWLQSEVVGGGVENMLLSIIKVHVVQEELEMFLL